MDFETYRIANRHLSESELRDGWAERTGQDSSDVDARIWREREDRNAYYGEIDGY